MTTFYDIKELFNDNTIITIYSGEHERFSVYDGKESIPEFLDEYVVNDIFTDTYRYNEKDFNAIGIELEFYKLDLNNTDLDYWEP